jgi:hypothetical protein
VIPIHPELDGRLVLDPPNWRVVYFLVRRRRVVYIGTTIGLPWERIAVHRNDPLKRFDRDVYFLPCVGDADMREQERHWIGVLRPVHNSRYNPTYCRKYMAWGTNPSDRNSARSLCGRDRKRNGH